MTFSFASIALGNDVVVDTSAPRIGGGGFNVDTGCQKATITHIYIEQSPHKKDPQGNNIDGGSTWFCMQLATESGATVDIRECFMSGMSKQYSTTYINKNTGKKVPLPGHAKFQDLVKVVLRKDLSQLSDPQTKVIEKYNFDLKKRAPTQVAMVMDLVGKEVIAGFVKKIEDKRNGDGTRTFNEVDRWYDAETRMNAFEMEHGLEGEAFFMDKWDERNKGQTRDTSTKTGGTTVSATPTGSLLSL